MGRSRIGCIDPLASLSEGGARRAEGVSCVQRNCPIIPTTPPQSAKLTAPPEGKPRGAIIDNIPLKLSKTDKHIFKME